MKIFIKVVFLSFSLFFLIFSIIAIIAYLDWKSNKERLISNLVEYYYTIKNPVKDYVILDEEGKIIEVVPTRIYDRNNVLIAEFSPSKRKIVQLADVPDSLLYSLILIEDKNFYKHYGIDFKAILRAAIKNILALKIVEGGSSITQQLAKIFFTSRKKTLYRKFLELYGAIEIEKIFKKEDILLMYINTVYLGHGCYGFKSGAEMYFNKDLKSLNIFEQSLLISLIPAPNYYSPLNNPEITKKKHFVVVSRLSKYGLISKKDLEKRFQLFWNNYLAQIYIPNVSFWKMEVNKDPYVTEYIRLKLLENFAPAEILQGGLKVYTTIDLNIQEILRNIAKKWIDDFVSSKTNKNYYQDLQTAIVVMDPTSGDVLAFIGGLNFTFKNQLNRAFNMKRQIGSTIKPLIYATAFDTKIFTPISIFTDKPISFNDKGRIWKPQNYDNLYRGKVFLKDGVVQSINTVSVQLLNLITPEYFVHILENIFYDLPEKHKFLPVLSQALGTSEFSPYEVAILFSVLANSGKKIYPIVIKKIENKYGETVLDFETKRAEYTNKWLQQNKIRIFSKEATFLINWILKDVFRKGGTAYYSAEKVGLKLPISGKTGTTGEFKDAWCVGYTVDYVVSVWTGFDDFKKSIGEGATGGVVSAPIICEIFNKLYWNKPYTEFSFPSENVVFCDIDKDTSKLASSHSTNIYYNVPFIKGTEPISY